MQIVHIVSAASLIVLLVSACSEAPRTADSTAKPKHVWSDQVEALHQAKEVAKYTQEQQKLNEQRLRELDIEQQQ